MDVIMFVLSEDIAARLGVDLLANLAELSTVQHLHEVECYLANPKADSKVKDLVERAYSSKLFYNRVYNDKDLLTAITKVQEMRYGDIDASTSIDELREYQSAISKVKSVGSIKPYLSPIKSDSVKQLCDTLKDHGFAEVAKNVMKYKQLFCQTHHARSTSTAFKYIYYKSDMIELFSRGIEFLLEMKKKETPPIAWRFL